MWWISFVILAIVGAVVYEGIKKQGDFQSWVNELKKVEE